MEKNEDTRNKRTLKKGNLGDNWRLQNLVRKEKKSKGSLEDGNKL